MMDGMSNPFFSVIVPAYNSENYIRNLLQSVKSQKFDNYELIVACDSCVDNTEAIAKEYGARTLNVNYNLDGLTRNEALDIAIGDWILFADDDDWFLHEFVFRQLSEVAGKHDEDAICFSWINAKDGYMSQTPDNVFPAVWTKCWRREFIGNVRFSHRKYWSDSDFHNKLMLKPHRFVYWDMPMYYYNFMREGSITQQFVDGQLAKYGNGLHEHVITKEPYLERGN